MRVAFVTPLQERSAIARVSLQVLTALRHRWDVDIWYPVCDRPHYTTFPTIPFKDGLEIADALRAYDLAVFVLGDSPYHLEILQASRDVSGLIILHDWSLTNLFSLADYQFGTRLLGTVADMSESPEIQQALVDRHVTPAGEDRLAELLPMTQVALQHSLGVLTHSEYAASKVRGHTAGLVLVAALPVPPHQEPAPTPSSFDDVLVVVAGLVNANKRVDRLIEAIASSDLLRRRMRLRVVGSCPIAVRESLLAAAAAAGLADRFELTGSLPRQEYVAALSDANAFACLRDPVLEAASASLLEEMATGRPVVVYDHGHYSELPDGSVIKVAAHRASGESLVAALESLVTSSTRVAAVGDAGRRHVEALHTAGTYAEVLLVAGFEALRARHAISGLVGLGRQLSDLHLGDDSYSRSATARAVAELFLPLGKGAST
jgi:glycosyltransferase involved in cell wall biosynthesis